jgi:hypothetical protein
LVVVLEALAPLQVQLAVLAVVRYTELVVAAQAVDI